MKKIKLLGMVSLIALGISSCTVYKEHTITNNAVGSKQGVAKTSVIGSGDATIKTAAASGNIDKIATVDFKTKVFLFFTWNITTVTGE